jgi:3-phenylpropionate/cinnamic acid dioxygenase small subunit
MQASSHELEDQAAITALLNRYATAFDEQRYRDVEACFAEDVLIDFPTLQRRGRDGFAAEMATILSRIAWMQHFSTNIEIHIDGDRASSRANCFTIGCMQNEEAQLAETGIYRHEFVRTRSGWLISKIRFQMTWMSPSMRPSLPDPPQKK